MIQDRRKFISTVTAGTIGLPLLSRIQSLVPERKHFKINFFSKPLDRYENDFICECLANSGIEGIDLTVRKDGKIEPGSVDSALPVFVEEARRHNLIVEMIVTGILSAGDPLTEKILKTASGTGVKYYRLGWFEYDDKTGIRETIQKYRSVLADIIKLNMKYNIHGAYQNHSGSFIGAPVWDLSDLLRDYPPEFIGSQYDVRHAMVEGNDTWPIGMRLIARHIKTLAIKDFTWVTTDGKPHPETVPLGEGMVDWDLYFRMVKELNIVAPITLHVEYPLFAEGEEKLSLVRQQEIIIKKIKKDTDFIKSYLNKYQLI
jgi:sugar phosphate isomerase/epimerase